MLGVIAPYSYVYTPVSPIPTGLEDPLSIRMLRRVSAAHTLPSLLSSDVVSSWKLLVCACYIRLYLREESLPMRCQNGKAPTGYLADDANIINQTQQFLDYVLDHQDSSGWIGPEVFDTTKPRYLWGR